MTADQRWAQAERVAAQGRETEARKRFEQVLADESRHAPSLISLSALLAKHGEYRNAKQLALRAAAQPPDSAPLLFGLAQRLRYHNCYSELETILSDPRLSRDAPARALAEGAVMLSHIGASDAAWRLIEVALKREPSNAAALYFRGNLQTFGGRFAEARSDYEACLRSDPRMFQANWMLSGLRTATETDNQVDELRRRIVAATPGQKGAVYLSFALFKELDDLGDYEAAWRFLEQGNQIERARYGYDANAHTALVKSIEAVCDASFVEAAQPASLDATPIFIIGMFRSGTTLLERMLAGHPGVTDGGETHAFPEAMREAGDHGARGVVDARLVERAPALDYAAVAHCYASNARWLARDKPFFTEKLPTNFLNAGFIAKALPQARLIHIHRDPVDTCFANLKTLLSDAAGYSCDQIDLVRYHENYRRLLDHWRQVMPDRVLDVRYADLVATPEQELLRIAAFCGLDFQQSMLRMDRTGGSVMTASATQVRGAIVAGRSRAWVPYREKLAPMLERLERLS